MSKEKISVILPTLNEQDNVRAVALALTSVLGAQDYEIIFVDGRSQDSTLLFLKQLHQENPRIHFMSMSRNFGQQMALKAGLDHASGDCIIFMDCDMQHPPSLVPDMLQQWRQGYEVVYTVREPDKNSSLVRRLIGKMFYSLINLLSDVPIIENAADFVLIDRKVARILKDCHESPLFLRGMIAWVGFTQTGIRYQADQRRFGATKYSLRRLIEFAIDGITSFSIKPLRLSVLCGGVLSAAAFIYLGYAVCMRVFTAYVIPGWASVIACVLFLGGIQLLVLGMMGEYLGKLFMQAKGRPAYIVGESSLGP